MKLMSLKPSKAKCQREVGLDRAGKPVQCSAKGYVEFDVEGGCGVTVCRKHFDEVKAVTESKIE